MEIECVGKKSGNGQILIDPLLINQAKIGSTIKLKIIVPEQKKKKGEKGIKSGCKTPFKKKVEFTRALTALA